MQCFEACAAFLLACCNFLVPGVSHCSINPTGRYSLPEFVSGLGRRLSC